MAGANTLADTGALLASLEHKDRWHHACAEALGTLKLPLLTSESVLTELFHFARKNPHTTQRIWSLVRSGAVELATIDDSELTSIQTLMLRYADRPMDFADATLVHLANRESIYTIFTVDHADFQTYRLEGNRRFRILPAKPQ